MEIGDTIILCYGCGSWVHDYPDSITFENHLFPDYGEGFCKRCNNPHAKFHRQVLTEILQEAISAHTVCSNINKHWSYGLFMFTAGMMYARKLGLEAEVDTQVTLNHTEEGSSPSGPTTGV